MEVAQGINLGGLIIVLTGLCLFGLVLLFILQFVGGALEILSNLFELVFGVLGGGPLSWCGCLFVLLGGCVCVLLVGLAATAMSSCGTPTAVNFCNLLGR